MASDKGLIVRIFPLKDYGFKKRVALVQFNVREVAGIEFHHERTELLDSLHIGDFVQVNYEIRSKVNDQKIYNNLIGLDIKKIC